MTTTTKLLLRNNVPIAKLHFLENGDICTEVLLPEPAYTPKPPTQIKLSEREGVPGEGFAEAVIPIPNEAGGYSYIGMVVPKPEYVAASNALNVSETTKVERYYGHMSYEKFLEEGRIARGIRKQLREGDLQAITLRLLIDEELRAKGKRGIKAEAHYDEAFNRIYILKSCTQSQAFELMLSEEGITIYSESDRADRWNAFKQAMKRRNNKFRL